MRDSEIEVHVGFICFFDNKCLILKRSPQKRLFPSLWECGGGKVQFGESFEDTVLREMREECQIEVKILNVLKVYTIDEPDICQKKIPGVKFMCEIIKFPECGKPVISDEHTEWKFISKQNVNKFDFIPGVDKDVLEAFDKM